MATYNNSRFTPGGKANLRLCMNKLLIKQSNTNSQSYDASSYPFFSDGIWGCIQEKANNLKQGWNDPSQTENTRIAHAVTGTLGGKITFGNNNTPVILNYLGGWPGQPGGQFRPLRNKF